MKCGQCGADYGKDDLFCPNCGAPIVQQPKSEPKPADDRQSDNQSSSSVQESVSSGPDTCPVCGRTLDTDEAFCSNCGTRIPGVVAPEGAPRPTQNQLGQQPLGPASFPGSGTAPTTLAGATPGAATQTQKKLPMLTIGLIAALVVVVLFAGVALLGGRNGATPSSEGTSSAQSGTSSSSSSGSASACTTAPDADVTSIDTTDGNMMVATVRLSSSCSGSSKTTFGADNTKIEITDSGSLVASAIFDFSEDPIDLSSSSAQVKLAFKPNQYWTVPDQTSSSSLSVSMGSASPADGTASSLGNGMLGGANALTNDERESDAHQALENQIEHDKSAANGFYTTYTTQLSSKRSGLNAEGKTWTYQDIWEEFLNFKERYPNALLIWSNDYPNYTKKGPSEWYVTLSGESFSSTDAADSWCSANGYDTDHCLPVDLS